MSRPFSIALILLGSAIIASLVWLHFHLMDQQHAKLFAYADNVNERAIEQKRQDIERLHWQVKEFFLDDVYTRRSVVLNIFTEAELRLEEYFKAEKAYENDPYRSNSKSLAVQALSPVLDTAIHIFQKYHDQMDMLEKDMQEVVDDFEQLRKAPLCNFSLHTVSSQAFELEQQVIALELLVDMSDLLYRVSSLSCYKGCGFDVFFPIVTTGSNYVEAGEKMELKMSVGSYSSMISADNIILVADGDSIRVGLDGTGDYSFRAKTPGKHTIVTKCIITNPLTGEVQMGEGTYTYRSY